MKRIHFTTLINTEPRVVWDMMISPESYKRWTAVFTEGSYYEGSWEAGKKIRFLASDGNGMLSEIAESRPHEFISIRHIGWIKDGVEDTQSEEVRSWTPAYENYSFKKSGGSTELTVDMDVTADFEEFMVNTWPKALSILKQMCETR